MTADGESLGQTLYDCAVAVATSLEYSNVSVRAATLIGALTGAAAR
jgi:hypothetical protein